MGSAECPWISRAIALFQIVFAYISLQYCTNKNIMPTKLRPNTWGFLLITYYLSWLCSTTSYYYTSRLYPFKLFFDLIAHYDYFLFPHFFEEEKKLFKSSNTQTHTHGSRLFFGIQQQLFIFDIYTHEWGSMKRMKLGRLCSSSLRWWFWLLPYQICSKIPTFFTCFVLVINILFN